MLRQSIFTLIVLIKISLSYSQTEFQKIRYNNQDGFWTNEKGMDLIYDSYNKLDSLTVEFNKLVIQNNINTLKSNENIKRKDFEIKNLNLIVKENKNVLERTKTLHKVKIKSNRKKNLLIGFGIGLLTILITR